MIFTLLILYFSSGVETTILQSAANNHIVVFLIYAEGFSSDSLYGVTATRIAR